LIVFDVENKFCISD